MLSGKTHVAWNTWVHAARRALDRPLRSRSAPPPMPGVVKASGHLGVGVDLPGRRAELPDVRGQPVPFRLRCFELFAHAGDQALVVLGRQDSGPRNRGKAGSTITSDAPVTDAPTTPTEAPTPGKPSAAKKPSAKPAKPTKPKPKPTGARAKRDAEFPWLVDAVRAARHLSGAKPNSGGDATLSYSGPAQHIKVREHVTRALGGNVTPDGILGLTGVKSHKLLREIAMWSADKSELVPLRTLSKVFNPDGWATGKYLASMLVVWCDELRRAAKKGIVTLADTALFEVIWLIILFAAVARP